MTRQQAWNKYMTSMKGRGWREIVLKEYIHAYRRAFMAGWKAKGESER